MESPARELTETAAYHILKHCPSCHMIYRTTPGVSPCPSCGDIEDTSGPTRASMATFDGELRFVRNWPLTLAALMLMACGPISWIEGGLRLSIPLLSQYLHHFAFLAPRLAHLSRPLPISPAFLAAAGTAVFSLGLLFVSLAKHQAVVQPPRKRDGEEEERPPMQLGVPEWLRAEGKPALEITATPKPAADPASLGTYFPS